MGLGVLAVLSLTSCAAYRTNAGVSFDMASSFGSAALKPDIIITAGTLEDRPYREIGEVSAKVKKLAQFLPDPTREQADAALAEKAQKLGADAVIRVSYKQGISWDSWGAITARGTAVKFTGDGPPARTRFEEGTPVKTASAAGGEDPRDKFAAAVEDFIAARSPKGYWPLKQKSTGQVMRLVLLQVQRASIRRTRDGRYAGSVVLRRTDTGGRIPAEFFVDPGGSWKVVGLRLKRAAPEDQL